MSALQSARQSGDAVTFRTPEGKDGPKISTLIANSPPLDPNSAYCNLLQCTHFANYCIVAERDGKVVGWISGYRPPDDPSRYFLWQVAIDASARGEGLARKMLDMLLARESMKGVTHLITTVTRDNEASWGLFRSFARHRNTKLKESLLFDRDMHFDGKHDSEWQAEIGPLNQIYS